MLNTQVPELPRYIGCAMSWIVNHGSKTRQGQDIFLIYIATGLSLGCVQCPMQWTLLLITHLHVMPKLRMCGDV